MRTKAGGAERTYPATHWALVPLVAGVLIGMSFSTVFLVQPYTAITNVYLELPSEREDADSRLGDLRRMLNDLGAMRRSGVAAKLADEVNVKAPVYYAVVMNHRHSAEQLQVLRKTWTKQIDRERVGYYIPMEDDEEGNDEEEDAHYGEIELSDPVAVVELASTQPDFFMDVVSHLCRAKLNDTKWFLLARDNVYVKPTYLENHLQQYENDPSHGFIGRPQQGRGSECMKGPGTVLSHSVLARLCAQIDECRGTVEQCITDKLECSCSSLGDEEHFLLIDSDLQGSVTEKASAGKLESALTLYPITDAKTMYSVHQMVVGGELNTTQHEMTSLKWALDRMTELLPHSERGHLTASHRRQEVEVVSTDDIVSWKLVNHNSLLSDEEDTPTREVPAVWRWELESMMSKAAQYLSAKDDSLHVSKRIVNAYWRVNPMTGIRYIIDFESSRSDSSEESNRHRISFTRALNPPEISLPSPPAISRITIAVCFTSEHTERLQQFLARLETALDHGQSVDLVAVQMKSAAEKQKPKKSQQSVVDTKSIFSLYRSKYQSASFTLLDSPAFLSRSHAIAIVLRESRPSQILFLADLDLSFDEGFLQRCMSLPLQGQQAYFPIMFSQRDPSLLASLNHTHLKEGSVLVSPHSGHWLVDSHSTACLYAADLLALSSQADLKGILNEVDMAEVYLALLERGYEVIRAPDRQLKMLYREHRACDLDMVGHTTDGACRLTGDSEYLRTQLSALLFDHEGDNSAIKY